MPLPAANVVSVEAECSRCGGTGLYSGIAEPRGVGVICIGCEGTGKAIVKYIPFTERQRRTDIKTVQLSRSGSIATGVGPTGTPVTYEEFMAGKMPKST